MPNIKLLFFTTILALFGCIDQTWGQEVDSNYIQVFSTNDQFRTGLRYKDLEVRFFSDGKEAFEFRNASLGLSLGGRIGKLGIGFTLPITDLGTSNTNEARRFGLNLQFYRPRYLFQLSGQYITGFQTSDEEEIVQDDFRDDIQLFDLTLYGFRIYNPRLSLRASFRNNQRQISSQGSWLTALSLNTQIVQTDSIQLGQDMESDFAINRYQQFEVGLGAGYAYTFVLPDNWYLTPVIIAGPEFRLLKYRLLTSDESRTRFRISPRFRGRLAFGYNGDRFFMSITAVILPGIASSNQLNTRVQDNQIRCRIGYRFL